MLAQEYSPFSQMSSRLNVQYGVDIEAKLVEV